MSSTGATLSGSFTGETGAISETGFYYGTTSGSLGNKVAAVGTSSPFSKAISGLSANTTYYFKAYVVEGGQEVLGAEESFRTKAVATSTVTTSAATGVGSARATLQGSFADATGTVYEAGFYWGTSAGNLNNELYAAAPGAVASGSFNQELTSLSPSTTYYYKAYVMEYNAATANYDYRYGSVQSFTTSAAVSYTPTGWLELPAVTGSEDFVGEFYGSGAQTAANRNYTYNYSYTWYASLWVAYPLTAAHTSGSGSTSSWRYNPNIANNKQVNIVSNSYGTMYNASAYARGHQIPNASRKSDDTMNLQTYYSTNQTPQLQNKFNGSIWGTLEGAVRSLTSGTDTVYVVTGPTYRKVNGNETINYLTGAGGQNANPASLPIPNYYWKALLKVSRDGNGNITDASAIGFWFEHRDYDSKTETYDMFAVSVDQIETWTGFDLFANLPAALQTTAEANTSWSNFQSF